MNVIVDNRAAVLALPGLLCDAIVWKQQAESLLDVADMTIADLTRQDDFTHMAVAALAQSEERRGSANDMLDVIGHSMGARVAFEIWRIAPERVRSLVLLDTGVHGVRPGEADKRQHLLDVSAHHGMQALTDEWLPPMVHPGRRADATFMRPLIDMVLRSTPEIHARQIRALLTRRDATDVLSTITVPTLVAVGSDDEWSPVDQHVPIAAAIEGAQFEVIADAGHMVTVEQPDAVNALLRDWLTSR